LGHGGIYRDRSQYQHQSGVVSMVRLSHFSSLAGRAIDTGRPCPIVTAPTMRCSASMLRLDHVFFFEP
jgi:hypothetical protein